MRGWRLFFAAAALLATGAAASGYALLGAIWNSTPVIMHLELGSSGTLIDGSASWNAVAGAALSTWNHYLLRLQFTPIVDSKTPGDGDGVNNVFFSTKFYGTDFGDAVAITTEWTAPGDAAQRVEADTIFNSNLSWNSYRGPLRSTANGDTLYDLLRVALHEFGHVVGLNHPDEAGQNVVAVMNSHVSDVDGLEPDDIEGGQFLYGAQPGTEILPPLATVSHPLDRNSRTKANSYRFTGSADGSEVQAVFLTNSAAGASRLFKAKGVSSWKLSLHLKPGRNVVTVYVRGNDGVRQKVTQKTITVGSDD